MLGLGAIAIICIAPADYCASLESATLKAVDWWAAIEPRAELTATLGPPTKESDWAFTLYLTDEYSAAWFGGPMRINRSLPPFALAPVISHEFGHIFGAFDEYPDCDYGRTIMCTQLAYYWPNPVSDATREAIGWHWPVYRTWLPLVDGFTFSQ